ncbi:MAG: site-specific integrase [Chloroflexota bacterium]
MAETSRTTIGHLTGQTALIPTLNAWEMHMYDQGRSPHTIKAFLSDVRLLADYLPPDRTLGAITSSDLNNFLSWLEKGRGIPCSPKSLARRITSIKSFFRWLQTGGVLIINPAEKVLQRSVISPLPQVLADEEVSAVLLAADRYRRLPKPDARPYLLLSLLLNTGIKKSECLGIHINHIDRAAPEGPLVFIRYASPANRYKERKIKLSDEWLMVYDEYLQQYNPVDQLFPWSPRRLEYLLEDIGKEAGLEKHLSFDMCRWTSSLIDMSNNVEPDRIRQKLGISKIQWREIRDKLGQLSGNMESDQIS